MKTPPMPPDELDRVRDLATRLREAERPVRILSSLAWSPAVRERFFAAGADRLPDPEYPSFDASATVALVEGVRRELPDDGGPVDRWIARQADAIENGARMLTVLGRPEFLTYGRRLYGSPESPLPDAETTSLQLAQQLDGILRSVRGMDLGAPTDGGLTAEELAERMRTAAGRLFGDRAPEIVLVDELSANALAGPRAIRIRKDARFSDRDALQLIHHEAYIHVATSLNGMDQTDLPILAAGHPGTTRTQEGLAVFAEFVSGTMDVDRLSRLVARVHAIQMSIDGADFLEVYRYFLGRDIPPPQAYESSRRVFRGGVLTGGAPFTKDGVYLDGLLRVHNFLRAAVALGRSDCLRLLFCGKLDLEDVPALCILRNAGACRPPRFLPPWARDLRFLVAYLAYSAFLNRVNLGRVREHFDALLAEAPRVEADAAGPGLSSSG